MRLVLIAIAVLFAGSFVFLRITQERTVRGEATLGGTTVSVEIAATIPTLRRGLSGRDSLPDGTGMVLQFPRPERHAIWMKDVRFAIDVVWVREGKIVDIAPNVPPEPVDEAFPSIYEPRLEADTVIELPAGFAAEHGLKIGDPVEVRRS